MHTALIAALIALPSPGADPFCDGLKGVVDAAPNRFAGVPLTLPNPIDPATPFECEIDWTLDEAVHEDHPDFACQAMKPPAADPDALERETHALDGVIAKCALPQASAMGRNGRLFTPHAIIDVGMTYSNDVSVTPAVKTEGLRITVHAVRPGADAAKP